jgi:RNA polymerase sigma-70 factor (ECF subfamily)
MRIPLLQPAPEAAAPTLRTIFDDHLGFITRVLTQLKVPARDIEDVTQEVLCSAWRSLPRFDPSRGELRAWLYQIARRKAQRYLKRASRHCGQTIVAPDELASIAASAPNPEEHMFHHSNRRLLDRILDTLAPKLREVFVAHELLEMTVPEIAQAMDMLPNTVKTLLHGARQDFNAAVERYQAAQKRRGAAVLPFTAVALILAERARIEQIAEDMRPRLEAKLERMFQQNEQSPRHAHRDPTSGLPVIPKANPFRSLLEAHAGPILGSTLAGAIAGAAATFALLWPLTLRPAWAQTGLATSLSTVAHGAAAINSQVAVPVIPPASVAAAPSLASRPATPASCGGPGVAAGSGAVAADTERLLTRAVTIALENGDIPAARAISHLLEKEVPRGLLMPSRRALQERLLAASDKDSE